MPPGLVRIPRNGPLTSSFAQERIWRLSRSPEASAGYTVASENRIRGALDVAAMRAALEHVVMGNEILRPPWGFSFIVDPKMESDRCMTMKLDL